MSMINALDYTIRINSSQFEFSSLTVSQNAVSSLNGRLVVNAGNDCFDYMVSIPKMIGRFLTHRYADSRMFFCAYSSMGGETTSCDIDRRINEVMQLMTVIENYTNHRNPDRNVVQQRFQRLSPQVRDLFSHVDQNYIDEFVGDPSGAQEIAQEMARECEQIITFQRQLAAVNAFYRMFNSGATPIPVTTVGSTTTSGITAPRRPRHEPVTDDFSWNDWWNRIFRDDFFLRGDGDIMTSNRPSATTIHSFNLNVPGTIPYDRNAIPGQVQQKTDEINRLKGLFAALANPPDVPQIYGDIIMADPFMACPVFDASHPGVQNALSAGATSAINNRDVRHLFDKDALEAHIRSGNSWAPAKCPTCRHPEHGGIRRPYLRIDTDLQDQILGFLRNAVGTNGSSSR
jgi:hypothetical protein